MKRQLVRPKKHIFQDYTTCQPSSLYFSYTYKENISYVDKENIMQHLKNECFCFLLIVSCKLSVAKANKINFSASNFPCPIKWRKRIACQLLAHFEYHSWSSRTSNQISTKFQVMSRPTVIYKKIVNIYCYDHHQFPNVISKNLFRIE